MQKVIEMDKNLLIIGAGGFGREALEYARYIKKYRPECGWHIEGFLDDNAKQLDNLESYDIKIVGDIQNHKVSDQNVYIIAIADAHVKKNLSQKFLQQGANFINLVHPLAGIAGTAKMGVGNIICPYSCVSSNVTIGNFVICNAFSTFGHDVRLEDFVTISSHCDITGHVILKEGCFFGSHAVACPSAVIGEYSKVGAGSVVLKRVKPFTSVFGIPAKVIQ